MNMELLKYMLDGILLSLLLSATGLLVWFHLRLNKLMENYGKMPKLSEIFGDSLSEAKAGVQGLSDQIGDQVMEAGKTLQEINYVLDRAEKMMQQFDERLDDARSQGVRPIVHQPQGREMDNFITKPVAGKKVVLPKDVVPKVVKEPMAKQNPVEPTAPKTYVSRELGGVSKKVRAFRPEQKVNGKDKVVFKNTSRTNGAGAYGAAAAAVQKSGGGVPLATEQEDRLVRALEERL